MHFLRSGTIVGFVEDIGIAIIAKPLYDIEIYANETIWEINSWLKNSVCPCDKIYAIGESLRFNRSRHGGTLSKKGKRDGRFTS